MSRKLQIPNFLEIYKIVHSLCEVSVCFCGDVLSELFDMGFVLNAE